MTLHNNDAPLTKADFDRLDRVLLSDAVPETCMMIDEIDGFMTALLCSPEAILPGEWLPVLWGGEPEFETEEEGTEIVGLLMRMYNDIALALHARVVIKPLFMEEDNYDGEPTANPEGWCFGFLKGLSLKAALWKEHSGDNLSDLLAPILALGAIDEEGVEDPELSLPEVKERLTNMIPGAVAGIREFWQKKGFMPFQLQPETAAHKEPCPCGSGRTFGLCCLIERRVLH